MLLSRLYLLGVAMPVRHEIAPPYFEACPRIKTRSCARGQSCLKRFVALEFHGRRCRGKQLPTRAFFSLS